MNEKDLYEKQYGERKWVKHQSFSFLRKGFKKFDLHRQDLTLSILDGGKKLFDVGCGSGFLAKFRNLWPSLLTEDFYIGEKTKSRS